MKKLLLTIAALFLLQNIFATGNTRIFGHIKNMANDKVYLQREFAFASSGWPVIDSVKLDYNTGNFVINLELKEPLVGAVMSSGKSVRIFLSPGDSLGIDMDINVWPSSIKFSGKGGNENTFYLSFRLNYSNPIPQGKLYGARPQYFAYICDSTYNAMGDSYMKFFKEAPASKDFEAFMSQKALYQAAARKMMYPVYQRFVKREDSIEARVDTSYYVFLRKLPFDNPVAYSTDTYAEFFYWYYKERAYEAMNNAKVFEDAEMILTKQFDIAMQELKNLPRAKEIALAKIFAKMIEKNYISNAGKMLEYLKQGGASTETVKWADDLYKRYIHLAEGEDPVDFTLPDSTGKMISLSSLKGKIVYIDCWASWCGPCRGEMPYSKLLIDKFKGQPVTFLFVSIDQDKNRWKQAMKQEKLDGIHVVDQRGWQSTLCRDYNFFSIPHYILIGADGKMVDPDAKRPSNGAYQQIQMLLDKMKKN